MKSLLFFHAFDLYKDTIVCFNQQISSTFRCYSRPYIKHFGSFTLKDITGINVNNLNMQKYDSKISLSAK